MAKNSMVPNDRWQSAMYDEAFADATIASKAYKKLARDEVRFLCQAMGLAPGESLLDVPCGAGRHAELFAARGVRVTGVDLNPTLIRMAKSRSSKKTAHYEIGNLLNLRRYRCRFDAVVNLFTSFGYFSTEEKNEAVMRGLVAALKPGGRIAFNLLDRDWLSKNFRANFWSEKKGVFTLEAHRFNPKTGIIEAQTVLLDRKTGQGKTFYHRARLYSKAEMVRLMKAAGLKRIDVYGDSDGSNFRRFETSHPTYVGWK